MFATHTSLARAVSAAALLVIFLVPADSGAVGSVSTVSARPLGMGGAFLAVEDELAAMAWNPAGLALPRCRRGALRVHLNLLGAPAIIRETGLLTGVETEPYSGLRGFEKLSVAVGSVVKGVGFRRGGLTGGLLMLEEHLDPVGLAESKGLADAGYLLDAYYTIFTLVFRLDPTVSIGLSHTVFAGLNDGGSRVGGAGYTYGVVLSPNDQVSVGLVYFDADNGFASYRRDLEGLAPGSVNAGVAYRHTPSMLMTFDLRDLLEESSETGLEPRFGLERNFWGRFALRTGWFREIGTGSSVLTLGIGAIPMTSCSGDQELIQPDAFVLNYTVLLAEGRPRHLLSTVLHF